MSQKLLREFGEEHKRNEEFRKKSLENLETESEGTRTRKKLLKTLEEREGKVAKIALERKVRTLIKLPEKIPVPQVVGM